MTKNDCTARIDEDGTLVFKKGINPEKTRENKPAASQSTKLVAIAVNAHLFHDSDRNGFAKIERNGHQETYRIRSKPFRHWLAGQYYQENVAVPGTQALQDAIAALEGMAIYGSPMASVHLRIAGDDDRIIIDLGNDKWDVVVVDRDGWRVEPGSDSTFYRSRGMLSLPYPDHCDDALQHFKDLLNIRSDELPLLLGWMIGALRAKGPYPILFVHGEQGSAKSTTCKLCRMLIDPHKANLRSGPRDERDAVIAASNNRILALENMSNIPSWMSDCLCRISTGSGFATRELYSDSDEAIFCVQRPIMVNGIEDLANRSDLVDRGIFLNLPTIPPSARRTETELWASFDRLKGKLLGYLLDALSEAIRNLKSVKLDSLPRMADYAKWIVAAEPAFGWNGDCLNAYNNNRSSANEVAIESNPIGRPILDLIFDVKNFEGTATELLDVLNLRVDESTRKRNEKSKEWPKSGRGVSGKLRRLAPNLRQAGIDVVTDLPNREIRISMQSTVATDPKAGQVCGSDGSDGQEHIFSDDLTGNQLEPANDGLRKRVAI